MFKTARPLSLVLVALMLTAGCIGAEDDALSPTATNDTPANASNETAANETPSGAMSDGAGNETGAEDNATAPGEDPDTQAPNGTSENGTGEAPPVAPLAVKLIPFSEDGTVEPSAEVCTSAGPGPCATAGGGGDRFFPLTVDGELSTVDLELTWESQSPANDMLRFGLSCVDASYADCADYIEVEGTSPLNFTHQVQDPDAKLQVYVWAFDRGPTDLAGLYTVAPEQPFHIEGTLAATVQTS